jgi:FkbM family methyltransferase
MTKRVLWSTCGVLVLLGTGTAAGYFGMRVGRKFGLLRFPSQIGQDRWVEEAVFPDVTNGYFLDVGSADGVIDSNTWALEQRGWSGICIDPFPSHMTGRGCQMFQEAVDAEGGHKVTFSKAGELGGITDYLGRWKGTANTAPTVEMTTVTLGSILERAHAPSFIHFMSLDIEGAELEALRGFPFARYTLGAMAIEHNYEQPKRDDIERFLNDKGYVRARTWMQDDFYVPRRQQ